MSEGTFNKIMVKAAPPLLVIGAVLVLYYFTDIFIQRPQPTPTITPTATIIPSEFPDYEAYQAMTHKLVLAQDRATYSPKNQPIVGRLTKRLTVSGQFSRIYLYIEASVDDGKPLTQWDSIYMTMNNVGGHLFRPDSLKVPGDTVTRLLYGLNQVPVLTTLPYSENKIPLVRDWFSQFTNGRIIKFDTFISSLRVGGTLNLVELRYECEKDIPCEIK